MTRMALNPSNARFTKDSRMHAEKMHFETSKGMVGLILDDHLLKARRFTAVKVSTAYTAMEIMSMNHKYPYANPGPHPLALKS